MWSKKSILLVKRYGGYTGLLIELIIIIPPEKKRIYDTNTVVSQISRI